MRIAVPDYVSNSYFPAIAALELGYLAAEGVDATVELLFPVTDAAVALRERRIDLLAGAAHAPMYAFPGWQGARLLSALSRNMYWFLVVRKDLDVQRGALRDLRNLRLGAAPGPDLGLLRVLANAGVDPHAAGLEIGPVPARGSSSTSFGVTAAEALADGVVDGFWANGMGAEVATGDGIGKVILDARRDVGPWNSLTFPALIGMDALLEEKPEEAAAVVRAIVRAQQALREDPSLAGRIGARIYPSREAALISALVERDAEFYSAEVVPADVDGLNRLGLESGLLPQPLRYEDAVATQLAPLWHVPARQT
jgi:NitT/TauT family transport system substrate-binding protein